MKMSSLSTHALNRLIVINRSLFSLGTSSISLRVNHAGIAVGSEETKIKAVRNQPRVYLLNQHKEPSIGFEEAMAALRAYSLRELPETVEIVLKCNMKYKKVSGCHGILHVFMCLCALVSGRAIATPSLSRFLFFFFFFFFFWILLFFKGLKRS